ncbi:MAG: hypothetical protein G3M70_09050 [Candidatus Nitronauta litoralis]|uniref:Uncharacterized protein n=1 Tax=Candidatus Nitronauta litoralis TaxID=2705533 RepID=A0A7T0G0N1_9BACT|nr:MAG: hypothetical protein G3M70_09050 [Candidatus Nitronauta litoralis]
MTKHLILLLILLGLPNIGWASTGDSCSPPYEPSNVIEATLRYSEAMDYIAEASNTCSQQFADQFIEIYRESWLISDGCLKVTIEDVEAALERRIKENAQTKKGRSEKTSI